MYVIQRWYSFKLIIALLECGKPAFRKANTTPDYQF